jgi:O-antigen/teichoic acid export membrane protein
LNVNRKRILVNQNSLFIAIRFLAEFVSRASALITFPIMAHYLGPEGYGVNAQINTMISFLVPVASLGLGYGVVRAVAGKMDRAFVSSRIKSTLLVILFVSGICSVIIFLAAPFINSSFIKVEGADQIIRWSASLVVFSSIELSLKDYYRARLRIVAFSVLQILQTIFYVGVVSWVLLSGYGLLEVVQAWLVVKLVFLLISFGYLIFVKEFDITSPLIPNTEMIMLLQYGFPIMIAGLGAWFTQVGDRWIIGYYSDSSQVGIYNAAYTLAGILSAIGSPFWSPLYPLMAAAYNQNDIERLKFICRRYMNAFCLIGIPAFFGLCVLSNDLITRFGTKSFTSNPLIFFFIAAALVMDQIATHGYYLAYVLNKPILVRNLALATAGINLILNLILVPRMGILGAAIATFIAYLFMDLVFIFKIPSYNYRLDEVYDLKSMLKILIASLVMSVVIIFIRPLFPTSLPAIFILIAIGGISYAVMVYFSMKNEILVILGKK